MKSRTLIVIVLALVCGAAAAVGVDQLRQRAIAASQVQTSTVVVTSMDVSRGAMLTEDVLTTHKWPSHMVPPGAITSTEEAIDRAVIVPLVRGEPVLAAKLADKNAGRGLAAMIPVGMRAFTIRTPHVASGVGGFIMPGNRVDVLLTTSGGRDDGTTTTLLQYVQILAVDQRLDPAGKNSVDPNTLQSVTLLVTPDQAAKLDLGMNKGILHLSLRNPEDESEARTRPATMDQLRFHQEKPVREPSAVAETVNQWLGTMANAMSAAAKAKGEAESDAQSEELPQVKQPRMSQIRTLRGVHRSTIRVEHTEQK